MISRTHILEIIGLGDVFDEGDIIEFEFEAPSHIRGNGYISTHSTVNFKGVLRQSDKVLYLFTNVSGFVGGTQNDDILYHQGKSNWSNMWIEVFVPAKIYVNSNTSSTEIDMASVINNNVIGAYARALLAEGTKQSINQSILFDKHISYRPDDNYWISKFNWTNLGSYRGNYIRYKLTFDNASELQYVPIAPFHAGYFNPIKPTKPYSVEGYQVSRNVLK